MKKFLVVFFMFGITAVSAAKYDGLISEAKMGLDHVAVQSQERAPEGSLGKTVYPAKVESDLDIFIPTDNYLRLGIAINLGSASSTLKIDGKNTGYDLGISEQFAFGWNLSSFVRAELGWMHNNMEFDNKVDADIDMFNGTVFFDLRRRYLLQGDITYRRKLIPFVGIGAGTGYAGFNQGETYSGGDAFVYSGFGALGISYAFSDITVIDLMARQEYFMSKHKLGWEGDTKQFRNTGILLSLRVGF